MQARRRWAAVVAISCVARVAAAQEPAQAAPPATAPAATAQPAPVAAPPSTGASEPAPPQGAPPPMVAPSNAPPPASMDPYTAPVPVWMEGDDGEVASVALYPEFVAPGSAPPVAHCTLPCGFQMPRGRYRLEVAETPNTLGGSRSIIIDGPSKLVVTPRDRGKRTMGLVLGIGGIVAVVAGIGLIADGVHTIYRCDSNGFCDTRTTSFSSEAGAGLAVFVAGAAITPIGWVMFGKSFHPGVDVLHPGMAAAYRPRIGVVPLRGGVGLGGSFVF